MTYFPFFLCVCDVGCPARDFNRKSICRERPTGLDLLNNSEAADTISTEATGKVLTDPAQTRLV